MSHLANSCVNAYKPTKTSLKKQNSKEFSRKHRHCDIKTE